MSDSHTTSVDHAPGERVSARHFDEPYSLSLKHWLARQRQRVTPPPDILQRVRWLFLCLALLTVLVVAVHVIYATNKPWSIRATASGLLAGLCILWITGYRRGAFPMHWDILQGLTLLIVPAAVSDPMTTVNLFYTGLFFRSFYGSTRRFLVALGIYLCSYMAGLMSSWLISGISPFTLIGILQIPSIAVMSGVMHLLQIVLLQQDTIYRHTSESRFHSLVQHASDVILLLSPTGQVLYQTPSVERIMGFPLDELIGTSVFARIHPDDLPNLLAQFHRLLQTPSEAIDAEFRLCHADGSWRDIEATGKNLLQDRSVEAIVVNYRDVTARRQAEQALQQANEELEQRVAERTLELHHVNEQLRADIAERQRIDAARRESEERFRILFEHSPDAITLIDPNAPDGTWPIIDANQAACRMHGYRRDELLGQARGLLTIAEMDADERASYLQSLQQHGQIHGETVHQRKDGSEFPVEYSAAMVTVGGRQLILGIDRDITERVEAQRALTQAVAEAEQANHAKSEFLSRTSHELRTPLNAILGFAQLMDMEVNDPSGRESVGQILSGGQHLLRLINEVLDIARIEAGRLDLSLEPVPLGDVVQECLDLVAPLAHRSDLTIEVDLPALEPFTVLADTQRFKQVLLNILSNAVKYNRPAGFIRLVAEMRESDCVRLSIQDSGWGIPADKQSRLFEPFDRLGAEQTDIEGTGLGLALSKRLAEAMGHTIGASSTVGVGTTLWLDLPLAHAPLQPGEVEHLTVANLPPARNGTALYIEDNLSNFRLVERLMARWPGFHLIGAIQGSMGLELAREHRPDIIFLDLDLPDMPGKDVLQSLRSDPSTSAIPVIVVSANATPRRRELLLAAGAHAYLTKPLDLKQLLEIVDATLG